MAELNGKQIGQLRDILAEAYPEFNDFDEMLKIRLDFTLTHLVSDRLGMKTVIFKVIQKAEAEGWTFDLIAAARESRPRDDKLLAFAQQPEIGLAPATPPRKELERIIQENNVLLDIAGWRTRLGEIENQVCRVEIKLNGGKWFSTGTGFLLGPEVLLTNYHVLEPVIELKERKPKGDTVLWAEPEDVTFRFDYKKLPGGKMINQGSEFQLAEDWQIDDSPMSPFDEKPPNQKGGDPLPDQLDYALVRLAGEPGNGKIGKMNGDEDKAPIRGWILLPEIDASFVPDSPLIIIQHPKGEPLKIALSTNAVIGLNDNQTRVTYRTNTEPGSSGSPCFDLNWNLIALHHAGDPNFEPTYHPLYNQGIPIGAILAQLEEKGLLDELGEEKL